MWTAAVVVFLPGPSEPFCGPQGFEFLDCQELIAQTAMEALRIPVLPWASWFNVKSRYVHRLEPVLDRMSNKLRAVVASNMFGDSSFREKSCKGVDNVIASDAPRKGSIRDLLIDGGYWANGDHLYMPAFGPFDVSDPNAPSLYTAIDVGEWIMGGATYDFYGNYSFTGGYTSSLPGIRVATSPWLWDPDYPGGWTVSSASDLFTGGAIVAFETNGAVVPEPSSWLLFAGGASSLLLIRRRRRSAHLCEASVA